MTNSNSKPPCQYRELCEALGKLAEKVRYPEEEIKCCEECLEETNALPAEKEASDGKT